MRYWHRLSKKEKRYILDSNIPVKEFLKQYHQPSWCDYPEALAGLMGCWSLMVSLTYVSKRYCKNCDCYIYPAHGNSKKHKELLEADK